MRNGLVTFGLVILTACSSSKTTTQERTEVKVGNFPELTSPVSRARLQERVDNIKFQKGVTLFANLERIASNGDAAIVVCLKGLKSEDPMTRMGCSYVLGRVGNTKTIPMLEPLLGDSVPFVRYDAAAALGSMGSRAGYRVLVSGLEDEKIEYRFKCFEALKEFTGQDFGYSHNGDLEVRKVSVQKWQDWLHRVESENL